MYEEKKFSGSKIHWLSVLIKLAILFLVVFLIWYFVVRNNDKNNSNKKLGAKISDNISYLKKQYVKYFNEKNIPINKNDETTVTLKELIDSKSSKVIYDKNGEKCSSTSSYGKLVKTDKDTYELKVYLKCKNEADSELYTITKKEIIDTTNKNTDSNKDNKDNKNTNTSIKDNDTKKTNTDNTNKTNTTDNAKKTNTNNTKTNTSTNTSKTNNVNNTNKQTNTTSTNKITNTTISSNTNSSSTSSTTTNKTVTETKKVTTSNTVAIDESSLDVEKITSDPSRIVLTEYLLYKLGNGTYTKPEGKKYITYVDEVKYYKYCNGNDMQNCHTGFAKIPANEQAINDLLFYGYTEYLDYTDKVIIYIPIEDELWSSSKEKDGYVYSGESRTHYRVN